MNFPNPFGYEIDATFKKAMKKMLNAYYLTHHECQNSRVKKTVFLKKLVEDFIRTHEEYITPA